MLTIKNLERKVDYFGSRWKILLISLLFLLSGNIKSKQRDIRDGVALIRYTFSNTFFTTSLYSSIRFNYMLKNEKKLRYEIKIKCLSGKLWVFARIKEGECILLADPHRTCELKIGILKKKTPGSSPFQCDISQRRMQKIFTEGCQRNFFVQFFSQTLFSKYFEEVSALEFFSR